MEYFILSNDEISQDFKEVARYLGYNVTITPDEKISALINECISEMRQVLRPALVFEKFSVKVPDVDIEAITDKNSIEKCGILFGDFFSIKSKDLCKNLFDCDEVILVAATIGSQVDFLIRKYQKTDSVKAGIMQATGAMFIESFVDAFNEKIKRDASKSGRVTKPRFSPGYGDVKLEVQKLFFQYLDTRKIGLTLMNTMIMAPEKSVTAFIGIGKQAK